MGNLHGGAAALIFDVCTTAALAPIAAPGFYSYAGVTRSLNVTYLRPVPVGSEVSVVCEVLHAGRRLVTIRGEIRVEGKVCAVVEHLKANIDPPPGEGRRLVRGGRL
ncbi:HotDog domain-containing protein [Geopyxis carbonaria]|nr:HotDog domain-containing protein [Geopyxis carbonaria]